MSWGWRSKETYGDKSANLEGGEAEKPAADEGAEKKVAKSIWEDDNDSWWNQYDKTRSTGGVTGSTTRDESYRAYSYDEAFDDSDDRWYRRNSFRYESYRDYSPSRLFRRSFTSTSIGFGASYTSSADNVLKNKAIQALRSLTRNANTVANKSAKINYTVKFSAGANSNSASDTLTAKTGKQQEQVIYVSPDDLAAASDDDTTDSVIDALTGFVLLRVQISQGIEKDVIDAVNLTGMAAIPTRLAGLLASGKISKETAAEAAHAYTDDYAAGILTKGLLTRLARRAVVKDWGGFAPYFVRHAKKFAAVREQLANKNENGLTSIELLAAQIAYNFVSDENPIPLDKEIEDIVAKHLGDELPAEQILPACTALITELRERLGAAEKLEAGQIEGAMHEILESLGDDTARNAEEMRKNLADHLEDIASFLDDTSEKASNFANIDSADFEEGTEPGSVHRTLNENRMAEKMLDSMKMYADALKTYKESLEKGEVSATSLIGSIRYTQSNIGSNFHHFAPRMPELAKKHDIDMTAFMPEKHPIKASTAEELKEIVKEYLDKFEAHLEKIRDAVAKELTKAKTSIARNAEIALQNSKTAQRIMEAQKEVLETLIAEADKLARENPLAEEPKSALKRIQENLAANLDHCKKRDEICESKIKGAKRLRSSSSAATANNDMVSANDATLSTMRQIIYDFGRGGSSPGMHAFGSHGQSAFSVAMHDSINTGEPYKKDAEWHEEAIAAFFNSADGRQVDFTTALLNQTHKELLQLLLKQLMSSGKRPRSSEEESDDDDDDSGGELPSLFNMLSPEQQSLVNNAAASLGMDGKTLYKILKQMQASAGKTGNAKAEALGQQIREKLINPAAKLSPVDEQLFGEQVKNGVKLLTGESLEGVHDEATHSVEEDFVAYLSHNDARPKVVVSKPRVHASYKRKANEIKNRSRAVIDKIRSALVFQNNKRTGEVHGLTSGDLDEGSLHKLRYDSEYIWSQKTITRLPDVAVGILVDQSGSMSCSRKIEQAREMCIVLAEAVKQIPGMHLHIYGHTANRQGRSDLQLFEHYSSHGDARSADLGGLGAIEACSNNYDGYAIKETAQRLSQDPAKKKYLFIIADGLPSGNGYGGEEAEKHVTSVCTYVRTKLKISTYAFGVGVNSPSHIRQFETQYGKNNVVFISAVRQALPKIVRFLRNVLQKERTLVDASED